MTGPRAIGLLGGSFDPVHEGHLQLARDALAQLPLAALHVLPAGQPWQKGDLAPAHDRAAMLRLALAAVPGALLDRSELDQTGPTYTVDTLLRLRAQLGAATPLVWIMGSDQFERLATWHRWEQLPALAHLAVAQRAGTASALDDRLAAFAQARRAPIGALTSAPAGALVDFAMTPVAVSSTQVRAQVAAEAAARAAGDPAAARQATAALGTMVPAAVLDYIRRQHLYR